MAKQQAANAMNKGGLGGAYFLAMIGAAVYFLQTSYGFWGSILALLKACVWPIYLIHQLFINMGV